MIKTMRRESWEVEEKTESWVAEFLKCFGVNKDKESVRESNVFEEDKVKKCRLKQSWSVKN